MSFKPFIKGLPSKDVLSVIFEFAFAHQHELTFLSRNLCLRSRQLPRFIRLPRSERVLRYTPHMRIDPSYSYSLVIDENFLLQDQVSKLDATSLEIKR